MRRLSAVCLMSVLAACGGASSEPGKAGGTGQACAYIAGGGTTVSWTMPTEAGGSGAQCFINGYPQAADADPTTYGTIDADVVTSECALRVTAQAGVVFPAGNVAAVLANVHFQGATTPMDGEYAIARTFLQGQIQDEVPFSKGNGLVVDAQGNTGKMFFEIPTSQPFDAVEFAVGNTTQHQVVEIFEFCSAPH